eukprot:jgi/Astpho2/1919/Aster-x0088
MPTQAVCHIIALTCKILDLDVEKDLKPVVQYIENQGVSREELPKVLLMHPKLLTFKVGSGKQLQSGKGRAQLDVIETDGQRTVGVSYFRDKTQWATSTPLKPFKPASS